MTQKYTSPRSLKAMANDLCPECESPAQEHSGDIRFWVRDPLGCTLTPAGVSSRIDAFKESK